MKIKSVEIFHTPDTMPKRRTAKTEYEFYGIKCKVEPDGYLEGHRQWAGYTLPNNGITCYERTKKEILATMKAECQMLAADKGREDSLDHRYNGELY